MSINNVQEEMVVKHVFDEIRPSDFRDIIKGVAPIRFDKIERSVVKALLAQVRGKVPAGIHPEVLNRFNLSDVNCFNTDKKGEPTTVLGLPVMAYRIEVGDDYDFVKRVHCLTGHIARERWVITLYGTHLTIQQPEPDVRRMPVFFNPKGVR